MLFSEKFVAFLLRECLSIFSSCAIINIIMFSFQSPADKDRVRQMNPVVLAFVGDAVYTLFVRERLALSHQYKTGELDRRTAEIVSAHGQSEKLEKILPRLTEEEEEIFRRGRNAKKPTKSKNASVGEYVRSTGFEALLGYLYLTGQTERLEELFFGQGASE